MSVIARYSAACVQTSSSLTAPVYQPARDGDPVTRIFDTTGNGIHLYPTVSDMAKLSILKAGVVNGLYPAVRFTATNHCSYQAWIPKVNVYTAWGVMRTTNLVNDQVPWGSQDGTFAEAWANLGLNYAGRGDAGGLLSTYADTTQATRTDGYTASGKIAANILYAITTLHRLAATVPEIWLNAVQITGLTQTPGFTGPTNGGSQGYWAVGMDPVYGSYFDGDWVETILDDVALTAQQIADRQAGAARYGV